MSAPAPSPPPPSLPPPQAMYLAGSAAGVFAILHRGAGPARDAAVLMCPPFGWEDMCSYRIRREWAEHLARAGHTALRIDLPGSGDSAGGPSDPAQLDAWTQAVADAALWLREDEGARRVAVIGIGLGGLVSCRACAQGAAIDELVLWSVPARGRALVRELRAFSRLEIAKRGSAGEGESLDELLEDGALLANGYLLSAQTVLALERADLGETTLGSRPPRRALLLGRDGLQVDAALLGAAERARVEVTVADGQAFGQMMVEPQDARAPTAVFELVSAWLDDGEPPRAAPPAAGATAGEPRIVPPEPPARRERQRREELLLKHGGVALRERPMYLAGPTGLLFGVLTEPVGPTAQLSALLLNAGPQRRTGPNRMWVEIARRWAAKGVPTLRLDADGIGDSDGDAEVLGQVTAFYRPRYAEQAGAVLELLAERGLPPRFVALGLCAGGYWAAQAALADERVARVIALNPRTLVFDEWRHASRRTRLLRERALMLTTWRRLLRGEIKLHKHLETGRTLVGRAAGAPLRARERMLPHPRAGGPACQPAAYEPVEELFDQLRDRGQRALLLFTGKEVLRGELEAKGVLERLERWPNLELTLIDTATDTHTLTPLWLQREVHAIVDRALEDELRRHAA